MLISRRLHERILGKKRRLDSLRPLSSALLARLREWLLVEFTYNSNAVEGNTLRLRETRLVIEEGVTVGGKSLREVLEARNHPEAIRFVEGLVDADSDVSEDVVLRVHRLVMAGVVEDAGRYRVGSVRIAGAGFLPLPSSEVKPRMVLLLEWLKRNREKLTPVELAAVFHHRFVQIHPFAEGNGRTARLLMNLVLMRFGFPFITIISKVDRAKYLRALAEADAGNVGVFVNFIARCVERTLDLYLVAVEEPEVLSLAEASRLTPYSQEYLSLLARKGLLGAFKEGRNWVVTRRDLEEYLKSVAEFRKKQKHKTRK